MSTNDRHAKILSNVNLGPGKEDLGNELWATNSPVVCYKLEVRTELAYRDAVRRLARVAAAAAQQHLKEKRP